MPEYIFLMHDDASAADLPWEPYLATLQQRGVFQGGSEIGDGFCMRKTGAAPRPSPHLTGFIRVRADDLDQAKSFVIGNPVFEAGGTVEIRELPRSD
jgi:hypothetical protein